MTMNRTDILKPIELKTKVVEVPGWGEFRIKQMSQSAAAKLNQWLSPKGKYNASRQERHRLKMVTLCVVDENGSTLLSEDDIPTLEQQPAELITDLILKVLEVNGYLDEDEDETDILGKSDNS